MTKPVDMHDSSLPWRPGHGAAAQQVQVQVKHRLAGPGPGIDHQPVIVEAQGGGNLTAAANRCPSSRSSPVSCSEAICTRGTSSTYAPAPGGISRKATAVSSA